jgi:hypothetical protein
MTAIGTKRLLARCKAMSGVGGKADLPVDARTSHFDPKGTSSACVAQNLSVHGPAGSDRIIAIQTLRRVAEITVRALARSAAHARAWPFHRK